MALEEFLLLWEEDMLRMGAVKRLLMGKVEKHKAGNID